MTFILRMPTARGARSRRKTLAVKVFDLGVMALIAFAVGLIGMFVVQYELRVEPKAPARDGAQLVAAKSMARVRWASVKPRLVARLAQPHSWSLAGSGRGATAGSAAWSTAGAASAA
jgi:hypothetical protein